MSCLGPWYKEVGRARASASLRVRVKGKRMGIGVPRGTTPLHPDEREGPTARFSQFPADRNRLSMPLRFYFNHGPETSALDHRVWYLVLDTRPPMCYTLFMNMAHMNNYEADPINLRVRETILDEKFLNSPIVAAQRIHVEYIKLCLKNPKILLPSALIL